jgi:hypothetical protein
MSQLAELHRALDGINLTDEDQAIFLFHGHMSDIEQYEASISDRNDYAVMVARTAIARIGCRSTRARAMPAA